MSSEVVKIGSPGVKYRGIFINDEMWGIRPWAEGSLASEEGRGQDDEPMKGGNTQAEKIALFERIFKDQREMLSSAGDFELHLDCLPAKAVSPDRGVRLAVSRDC